MGIGILIGNLARVIGAASLSRTSHRGVLAAAGLIAGDSLFSLLAGILIVCGIELSGWEASTPLSATTSGIALLAFCGLSVFTYWDARKS